MMRIVLGLMLSWMALGWLLALYLTLVWVVDLLR